MDQLDDSTVLIAALCATAAAGALVFVNVQSCQGERRREKAKKKRVKRRKNVDKDDGIGWTPPESPKVEEEKKKKKKKKKSKSKKNVAGADEAKKRKTVRKKSDENLSSFIDDGSNADAWSVVGQKKTRSNKNYNTTKPSIEEEEKKQKKEELKTEKKAQKVMDIGNNANAVIGKKGATIRNIEEQTGCRLNIDKKTNVLTVTADTSDKVDEAEKMVLEIISKNKSSNNSNNTATTSVKLDLGDKVGAVIGKGGSTIREIEESSGALLDIERDRTQGTATLTIRGNTQESVDIAKSMVTEILNKENALSTAEQNKVQTTIDLETRHVVMSVIGRGGSKIRQLETKSGARLSVKRDTTVLEISGTEEQVKEAKTLVQEVISSVAGSRFEMKLTRETVGYVIGRGGSTIREIQQKSGARLQIVRDNRNSEDVSLHISGNANSVETAKKLVNEAIAAPSKRQGIVLGPGEVEVSIELGRAVGSVIGKGGSNVIRIENETGAKINIERGSSTCQIYGEAVAVAKAKDEVESIVQRVKENDEKKEAAMSAESPKEEDFSTKKEDGGAQTSGGGWGTDAQGW